MLQIIFVVFWGIFLTITSIAAKFRGGWAEKLAAIVSVIGWIGSYFVVTYGSNNFAGPDNGLFAIDVILLFFFAFIATKSRKIWPLVTTGFQLCSIAIHIASYAHPVLFNAPYFVSLQLTSSAVILTIGFGVFSTFTRRNDIN